MEGYISSLSFIIIICNALYKLIGKDYGIPFKKNALPYSLLNRDIKNASSGERCGKPCNSIDKMLSDYILVSISRATAGAWKCNYPLF